MEIFVFSDWFGLYRNDLRILISFNERFNKRAWNAKLSARKRQKFAIEIRVRNKEQSQSHLLESGGLCGCRWLEVGLSIDGYAKQNKRLKIISVWSYLYFQAIWLTDCKSMLIDLLGTSF